MFAFSLEVQHCLWVLLVGFILAQGQWVWMPSDEDGYLPTKVVANFKRGEKATVESEDGEVTNPNQLVGAVRLPLLRHPSHTTCVLPCASNTRCQPS